MPNEKRVLVENAFYHVVVRGNQKQRVFKKEEDFKVYLQLVRRYKRRYVVKLYGFCLMPNHVHLLGSIQRKEDLSKFMQGLNLSYAIYCNGKYNKVGHIWQGRFRSKAITKTKYAVNCIDYIECNPVRAGIVDSPQDYKWSSYRERIIGAAGDSWIVDPVNEI